MTIAELFRGYWWLIFPLFGMFMAFWGMVSSERRTRHLLDLMKSYSDQGKEPPADLVRMVTQGLEDDGFHAPSSRQNRFSDRLWTLVTFLALAAGFSTAYAFNQSESWSWVFLMVAVTMAIMAAGALLVLLLGAKK